MTAGKDLAGPAREFDERGYVVVKGALPPAKVADMLAAVGRVRERLMRSPHRREVFGLDVRPIVTEDDAFLELMEWPATFPLAVQCLGHFNLQLTTSHLIIVPPRPGETNIGWHSDGGSPAIQVGGIRALASLKVGFFLTDLPRPNMGSLMVVPGSHRKRHEPVIPEGRRDPEGAEELALAAGDAVIFGQGVWHAGAPNTSDRERIVLYFGYGFRLLRPIDYEAMPEDLLARCTPIGRQLLGARSSHLGYYIPTDEDVPLKAAFREWFGETWRG